MKTHEATGQQRPGQRGMFDLTYSPRWAMIRHTDHQMGESMAYIFHITSREQWTQAQQDGAYRADSLAAEGFIHCSTGEQVVKVANRYYQGQSGLVLLCLDTDLLQSEVRFEDASGAQFEPGEQFPHVYGPINLGAVVKVVGWEPGPDGTFGVPGKTVYLRN
jgi:uncharacterized protein (DUF952 family)